MKLLVWLGLGDVPIGFCRNSYSETPVIDQVIGFHQISV